MPLKPPLSSLPIRTADKGFYKGFSMDVTLTSKIIVGILIMWAVIFPAQSGKVLNDFNGYILAHFATWYLYVMAVFVAACVGLALWPSAGRLRLGHDEERPEFSNFSWFSMMFGAGIGVGMLTWAVAEPVYHFANNPDVILGHAEASTSANIGNAYKWSFLHWGFSAWSSYAIIGLALAFFAYRRSLPLTIRSALTPLFGKALSGPLGHAVDVFAVVATILGVAQTLGFGVEQFIAGMNRIGFGAWMQNTDGSSSVFAILLSVVVIMIASTLSALSGVGKGIKWLSNLNMGLSIFLLAFLFLFGSTWFGTAAFFTGMFEYILALPAMVVTIWKPDGTTTADGLAKWQGAWTVFYWAWWVAFAPFVGLFLARISRGRTIREFVLGAMIVPSLMCFVWFAWAGGTAIDLEMSGIANGAINAGGDEGPKARPHIIFWGVALGGVVAALLLVGGLDAIKTAMVIGALPFSMVMLLMCMALIKAIYRDGLREKAGIETVIVADPEDEVKAVAG